MLVFAFVRAVGFEQLGRGFPFSFKRVTPCLKNVVELVGFKPNITEGGRVVVIAFFATPKTDQPNAILYIELQYIAPVVERLIAIRCPHESFGIEAIAEFRMRKAEEFFAFLVRGVNGITVGVGDFSCIRLICERCDVHATLSDSFFNRVK